MASVMAFSQHYSPLVAPPNRMQCKANRIIISSKSTQRYPAAGVLPCRPGAGRPRPEGRTPHSDCFGFLKGFSSHTYERFRAEGAIWWILQNQKNLRQRVGT